MVFSSRDLRCKSPFGAVSCGTSVQFTLRAGKEEHFTECSLLAFQEFSDHTDTVILPLTEEVSDIAVFHGSYTAPSSPELVWYGFRFTRQDGCHIWYGKNGYCQEYEMQRWQLTVYDDTLAAPAWFGEGVTYQIFPDRFCRLTVPDPQGMVGHRSVHENWEDTPDFLPDSDGEIHNSDFFGGSLAGVLSKLDYLQSLCVTTLYFCPIFESASNHRYNTADYLRIDPMLGTEADLSLLCREAEKRGIRVVLDGVFNHTGNVSRYFNADGFYNSLGAAQSQDSPYYPWYRFSHWPDSYDAWWGVRTLPAVEESNPDYVNYIIDGEDSVIRHWLRCGASGWRLDVADELPDWFIAKIRRVMDEEKPGSLLLGEVWEDGSNKIAYSQRRRYLLGRETHGLMNYPFRTAALQYLTGGDAVVFRDAMETLRENYPPSAFYSAMNMLGTHDTPRILTLLGLSAHSDLDAKAERAAYRLREDECQLGLQRLRLAALLLFTFPGSPTVFYGDEAGMEGFEDPLNRGTFPWGKENLALQDLYRQLGALRKDCAPLRRGDIAYLYAQGAGLSFVRTWDGERAVTVLNAGPSVLEFSLPLPEGLFTDALTRQRFFARDGLLRISLPPLTGVILLGGSGANVSRETL